MRAGKDGNCGTLSLTCKRSYYKSRKYDQRFHGIKVKSFNRKDELKCQVLVNFILVLYTPLSFYTNSKITQVFVLQVCMKHFFVALENVAI